MKTKIKKIAIFSLLALVLVFLCFSHLSPVSAQEQTNWVFDVAGNYTYGSNVEITAGKAHLKQNYTPGTDWLATDGDGYDWAYHQEIEIDTGLAEYNISDYQMKIELDSDNFDFAKAQLEGNDIRITGANNLNTYSSVSEWQNKQRENEISYWKESYDKSAKSATFWAKVPSIFSTNAETNIAQGETTVKVTDISGLKTSGYVSGSDLNLPVKIKDDNGSETIIIKSIDTATNILTFTTPVKNSYLTADNARVARPESIYLYYGNSNASSSTQTTMADMFGETGLVGFWKFEEGEGTTTKDYSGTGSDGDLENGPTWVSGKVGEALSFNGSNSWVSVPNPGLNSNFSIEAWVYPRDQNYNIIVAYAKSRRLFCTSNGSCGSNGLLTQFDGSFCSNNIVPSNTWTHVVYVFDEVEGKEKYYINGEFDNDHSTNVPEWNAAFGIGGGTEYYHYGSLDEIKIYSEALSENEIQAHYNNSKSVPTLSIQPSQSLYPSVWQYRRPVTINNTGGGALTDYQIKIDDFNTQALISAGKMNSDCSDVRFADSNETTELNYWIKSGTCNTASTEIWVEVLSIPESSSKTIYMYYGNNGAGDGSSYDNTMTKDFGEPGLQALWHMDEGADNTCPGGQDVCDSSGQGNHGTGQNWDGDEWQGSDGGQWDGMDQQFSTGDSLLFDNTNDYVEVLDDPSLHIDSTGTIEMWFKFNYVYAHNGLFSKAADWAGDGYVLRYTAQYGFQGGWEWADFSVKPAGVTTGWHQLVMSTDGSMAYLYLDGNLIASNPTTVASTAEPFLIGKTFGYYFNGTIDEVRIYNRALSLAEIKAHYERRKYTSSEPSTSVASESDVGWPDSEVAKLTVVNNAGQGYASLVNFIEILGSGNEGSVKYQISDNSTDWYWYDSSQTKWVSASGLPQTNTSSEVGSNISDFMEDIGKSGETGTFFFKAFFISDGSQKVELDSITLTYVYDTWPPENPTDVQLTANSQQLTTNTWYNFKEGLEFTWPTACDPGIDCDTGGAKDLQRPSTSEGTSGVDGYYVYFGKDLSADPEINGTYQVDSPTGNSFDVPDLSDSDSGKTFYLRMKSKDKAGNISDAETLFIYKLDLTKPTTPSSISHVPVGYTPKNEFTFIWEKSTDLESGLKGYCYKTDNPNFSSDSICNNDGKFTKDTTISTKEDPQVKAYQNGVNLFYVRSLDKAQNFSDWLSDTFYFAGEAPLEPQNLTCSPSTSEKALASKNEFSFAWSKPLSYSSPISGYYYSINTLPSAYTATFTQETSLASAPFATQQGKNTFYVVALDEAGNIDWANYASIDFYCKTKAPGPPRDLTITDASIRAKKQYAITLMWSEPKDKGSGIDQYTIERAEKKAKEEEEGSKPLTLTKADLTFEEIAQVPSTSTGYLDTNLDTNKVYYYQIKAQDNAQAVSRASEQVGMRPEGRYTSPPEITEIKLEAQSFGAKVTWKTDRPTTSHVQFGKKSTEEKEQGVEELVEEHEITIVGLDPETTYLYRVKSKDRDENINYSDISTFKTLEAPKVSEVAVSDITLTGATISWKTNLITTSKIEYGTTTDYGLLVYDVSESKVTSHTLKLESLSSGTTYHYRIGGVDLYGNTVLSDDYTFATPPYPEVISQTTENKEEGKTEVRWSTNVATTSEVEYWSEEGNIAPKTQGTTPKVIDHAILLFGLEDDTTYQFRLRGRDQFGNEAVSDTFTFHTLKDTTPPVITEVYSESNVLGYGEKQKVQIIVAWKTNEPASSKVYYGEGVTGEFPGQTEEFGDLVLEHLVVVSDLSPSKIYHFKVESFDKARNSSQSEIFTVLTSRKRESFLQLIVGVLEDTFSWVRNIKITR